jgi:Ca-activated chloride channel family protein
MLKSLLILLLFSACILHASASKFGLKTAKGEPLELLELKTKALVEGPYAEIQYIQTYKNPLNHTVETEFHFPRTDSSIFHKFEAVFKNHTLVGRVLEKETAKKMFDWNTQRGNTVAYSERSQVAPDVMNIKVGNIPANETVEIIFSVIQPLETIINKFYELKLPVVLTERYSSSSVDLNKTPDIRRA